MTTHKIASLKGGDIAADGGTVNLDIKAEDGTPLTLILSFDQFTWLLQSLLELSNDLYQRQVDHGRIAAHDGSDDALMAEGFQIVIEPNTGTALIQVAGRRAPEAPLGLGAFRVSKVEFLRGLAAHCTQAANELEQRTQLS
jgi:hypothetical protein